MKAPILLAIFLLAACSPSSPPDVPWSNYHPSVKERVDRMGNNKDCTGLQTEFDVADENDDSQRARTGRSNSALLDYIDRKLSAAGCYR